jgi:outer membrane protein TolC
VNNLEESRLIRKKMKMKLPVVLMTAMMGLTTIGSAAQTMAIEPKKTSFSLAEAQAYAIENNLNVENARLDFESAQQLIRENVAMGLPQISGEIGYTNNLQLMTTLIPAEFMGGEPGTYVPVKFGTQHNGSASIIANQMLFNGPWIAALQAAGTYKDLMNKTLQKSVADIKEAVAQGYYSILLAEAGRDAFAKNLESMKSRLEETKAMQETGFLEATDVDQLQIAVSNLENEYIAAKQLVDVSYRFLIYRMGYGLDSNIVITETLPEIISGLTRDLIEQEFMVAENYDYRIVDAQEKLAAINVKRFRAEYLPTLTAYLSHQQMAMRNDFNFFSEEGDWYPATMLGISLNIPVFSSGMRKARISQARIDLQKTQNTKQDLASALELQVQQARIDFRTAYRKYLNQKSNIALAQKIFDQTSLKHKSGLVSSLELTIATEQLTAAQTGIIQAMVELLNTKLSLDKALGNI